MQPDGGAPEQLTDDELNNWFPHVSPDGQFIVFLSYGPDVDPGDHPFYKAGLPAVDACGVVASRG